MAEIKHSRPQLGKPIDAPALADLFCTGEKEICLKPDVCTPGNRRKLTELFDQKCSAKKILVIRNKLETIGMLVLGLRLKGDGVDLTEIDYVVVAPQFRGRGIGPALVRAVQARKRISQLRAEARNEKSRRMLARCGFQVDNEQSDSGHPIMYRAKSA